MFPFNLLEKNININKEKLYLERWEEVRLLIIKTLKIPIKLSGELEVRDSHEDTVIGGHEQKESVIDPFRA